MKYVVDASVGFKWAVAEIDSDKANRLREGYRNGIHSLLSPDIFPAEIANSLVMAERRGRIADHAPLLFDILTTCPTLYPTIRLLPRVSAITRLTSTTVYDAIYVALAESESCELVTADDRLLRKVQQHFPFLVALSSLP
jgi:predicted nucleic acid-binding protein